MACEEYARWLTDCALGQLSPSRESELMAHVSNCASCRQASERAQEAAKLVDKGMESLVAGEPSPRFTSRLRSRIADKAATSSALTRRLTVATSLALCAALVALASVSYLNRGTRLGPTPRASAVSPGSRLADNVKLATSPVAPVQEHRSKRLRLHRRAAASPGPEVLVEPGQMAALTRYVEALQRYQAAGARMVAHREDANSQMKTQPIEIQPLQIEPIRVPKIQGLADSWQAF